MANHGQLDLIIKISGMRRPFTRIRQNQGVINGVTWMSVSKPRCLCALRSRVHSSARMILLPAVLVVGLKSVNILNRGSPPKERDRWREPRISTHRTATKLGQAIAPQGLHDYRWYAVHFKGAAWMLQKDASEHAC